MVIAGVTNEVRAASYREDAGLERRRGVLRVPAGIEGDLDGVAAPVPLAVLTGQDAARLVVAYVDEHVHRVAGPGQSAGRRAVRGRVARRALPEARQVHAGAGVLAG